MDNPEGEVVRVQLNDLSPDGAALAVDTAIEVGTEWLLQIHSPSGEPDRSTPVVIRWNRTDDCGRNACGVEFRSKSEESAVPSAAPAPDMPGTAADAAAPNEHDDIGTPGVVDAKHLDVLSLQNVRGRVGGNVTFESELVDCSLQIDGDIVSNHGAIRGGVVHVAKSVQIGQLGDSEGSLTELVVGSMPNAESMLALVPGYLESIDSKVAELNDEHAALKANIDSLDHSQKERMTEITFEVQELKMKRESVEAKKMRLEDALRSTGLPAVIVSKAIYAGVTIRYRDKELVCDELVTGPVAIKFDENGGLGWGKPAAA